MLGLRQDLEAIILAIGSLVPSQELSLRTERISRWTCEALCYQEFNSSIGPVKRHAASRKLPRANIANTNLTGAIFEHADL